MKTELSLCRKWIAALRSGEYEQGRLKLRSINDEFCCLGVGCDVVHKETGVGVWETDNDYRLRFVVGDIASSNVFSLDDILRAMLGITTEQMEKLIKMNDGDAATFEEIADYLEGLE